MQRYNFEIHITVECKDEETLINFESICNKISAKAISINLINTSQTMTSKTVNSTEFELYNIIADDKNILIENGFNVLRIKVESCPKYIKDHPDAVFHYYEIHVPCFYDKVMDFNLHKLDKKWHRSFNLFKDNVVMLTCRENSTSEIRRIDRDIEKLKSLGFVTDSFKHHYEYAIADSNIDLDKGWIN